MSDSAQLPGVNKVGWRFGIGIALIVAGYVALTLLPVVAGAALALGLKAVLTAIITLLPVLTKVAAVAVMGKPGFNLLKGYVFKFLGRFRPAERVTRGRYRAGLVLFVLSFVFDSLLPYFPGILIDWESNKIFWSLVSDAGLIVSLFMLGGEFWSKLAALFDYDARA